MSDIITIRSLGGTKHKLHLVKLFKDFSNLSLKESKFLCDDILYYPNKEYEFQLRDTKRESVDLFISKLNELGDFEINGGTIWDRNLKLLEIGIGKEDLPTYMSEYILSLTKYKSYDVSFQLLKSKFSKLDQDKLEEIYKIITE